MFLFQNSFLIIFSIMAFVYQTQRWKLTQTDSSIGPGHYNAELQSKHTKNALITPQPRPKQCLISKTSPSDHVNQENLRIVQENQKNKPIKNSPTRHLKRAATAKCTLARKSICQSPTIFKPRDMNLQVTNSNNQEKKSFQNSIIRKSLRKHKKSIHSELENFTDKQFCDKSIRTYQTSNPTVAIYEPDTQFFNTMFTKSFSNPNLTRFVSSKCKTQNIYFSSEPSFLKEKEPQNFIIASGNCRKQTIKPSKIKMASTKDSRAEKLNDQDDMQTTGIDDSLDSSFEYIHDSTPGPGQYDLRKDKPFHKSKVEKFGVTQMRFRQPARQETKLNLNVKVPCFKKTSRAPQHKVSFGKSRPQTAKQITSDLIFYDDTRNIENQCIKNLIKDRQAPGTFLSRCGRFTKKKPQVYNGPDFFEKDKKQKITLPNSIFMSNVQRYQRPLSPTAEIDFEGQKYKTIEQKLDKFMELKQIVDGQLPGFNVSEARFKYKQREQGDDYPIRPLTSNAKKDKQVKSYTFRKGDLVIQEENTQNPAPWTYNVEKKWLKPSHHIRFKF